MTWSHLVAVKNTEMFVEASRVPGHRSSYRLALMNQNPAMHYIAVIRTMVRLNHFNLTVKLHLFPSQYFMSPFIWQDISISLVQLSLCLIRHHTMETYRGVEGCLHAFLTLRRLMSYIYGAPILDVSRSHTTTQHSR